jgi:prepilin-type N-terminal cleavage/methylation domain-containing protein
LKKKILKGFTLIELIIVMAIFTIVMYSVTQLIDPVSKYFVRSSNFESTTACLDNITRAIEGNLQYADRVRAYSEYDPGTIVSLNSTSSGTDLLDESSGLAISADLKSQIAGFYNDYFQNRRFLGCKGKIHVMIFDNESRPVNDTGVPDSSVNPLEFTKLGDYSKYYANKGRIIRLTFDFDNYGTNNNADEVLKTIQAEGWYVNQKLYGNFDYSYTLGDSSVAATTAVPVPGTTVETTAVVTTALPETDADGSTVVTTTTAEKPAAVLFNPSDFVIAIEMHEIRRERSGGSVHLTREEEKILNTFSCTMKNVLNNTNAYNTASLDTILFAIDDATELTNTGDAQKYYVHHYQPRYEGLQTPSAVPAAPYTGFYFIYTLPDEIINLDQYPTYNDEPFREYIITQSPSGGTTPVTTTTV